MTKHTPYNTSTMNDVDMLLHEKRVASQYESANQTGHVEYWKIKAHIAELEGRIRRNAKLVKA